MTEQQNPLPPGAIEIPENAPVATIRPQNMPTMYVNNIGIGVGPVEVRLLLGEVMPNQDGQSMLLTQRLAVVMTPEYAKVLAETLMQAIGNLEKQFGTLRHIKMEKKPST